MTKQFSLEILFDAQILVTFHWTTKDISSMFISIIREKSATPV